MKTEQKTEEKEITIKAPKIEALELTIRGTAPYVQAAFPAKARQMMRDKMAAGSTAKSKRNREARNFDEDYKQAMHRSTEGWIGIPASAFRSALIRACSLVNFKMTLAKLSLFIVAQGFDDKDGTPLIKIEGTPEKCEHMVRNATGVCDIRVRAMWREWSAKVVIQYDADQFTQADVVNLFHRVGVQVGIGEGRPGSRESAGMGWGTFSIEE
jgi:hypothetical protein